MCFLRQTKKNNLDLEREISSRACVFSEELRLSQLKMTYKNENWRK
jgi:hypothetical protein